jgi:hypothetical protein
MFTNPTPMPFTVGCVAGDVVPPAMKTLGVTITLEESLLASRTFTPPAGAGPAKVTGSVTDRPSPTVVLAGRLIVLIVPPVVTCTSPVAGAKPLADAVMIADPALMPFTIGARLGADAPCGMKIFSGATVTVEGSLLVSVMNTPPDGAAVANVTGKGPDWPGATVVLAGRMICPAKAVLTMAVTRATAVPPLLVAVKV